jgi:hypothetical protein
MGNFIAIWLDGLKEFVKILISVSPNPDFLADVATFEGVLIALGIPVSLQVVNISLDRYKDPELGQFFIKERLYSWQYFLLLPNIATAILLRFLDVKNPLFLWLVFVLLLVNIVVFYFFIKLVEKYMTSFDKVLLDKIRKHVQDILKK